VTTRSGWSTRCRGRSSRTARSIWVTGRLWVLHWMRMSARLFLHSSVRTRSILKEVGRRKTGILPCIVCILDDWLKQVEAIHCASAFTFIEPWAKPHLVPIRACFLLSILCIWHLLFFESLCCGYKSMSPSYEIPSNTSRITYFTLYRWTVTGRWRFVTYTDRYIHSAKPRGMM